MKPHSSLGRNASALVLVVAGLSLSCSSSTPTTGGSGGATAVKLAFIAQPTASVAGSAIGPAVQVEIQDASGATVAAATNTVSIAITSGTGATGATLSGTKSAAATAGVAAFANLSIDKAATGYTLSATASGLTGATSSAFAVGAAAAASVAKQAGDSQSVAAGSAVTVAPSVVVKDAYGNPKSGATVTFAVASGGGSVGGAGQSTNASGIATVGSWTLGGTAGANTLTATVTGTGIAGNPVTFTATGTGGAPPTTLFAEHFDDPNLASRGWYDTPTGTGVSPSAIDTSQKQDGTGSLLVNFVAGSSTVPNPPVAMRHQFTASNSVYLRFWVKYDSNWVGSGLSYHPHEFYILSNLDAQYAGPAADYLDTYVEHNWHASGTVGGYAIVSAQDVLNIDQTKINVDLTSVTENRAVSGCNGNTDAASGASYTCYATGGTPAYANGKTWTSAAPVFLPTVGTGYKGNWNEVEAYFQMNSIVNGIGQLDGVVQYWFNGTLIIDKHNVLFRTGAHPTMQFGQFVIGPYMGNGAPVTERAWYDNLVVMTAHP